MVSAAGGVGSGQATHGRVGTGPELAQLQKQLSDCVNCESSKTSKGQAEIARLSARIAAIQTRQLQAEQVAAPPAAATAAPRDGPLGTQLDVYA